MTIDLIIPSIRTHTIDRLLYSLRWNSVWPDRITIISNEIPGDIEVHGLPVRILRFRTGAYPAGNKDVALRRNIGIWNSDCSHVVTFDDDQIAPVKLIEDCKTVLARARFFWGHYRYISFTKYPLEELLHLPPQAGRQREHPPNAWHNWASAYGGLFGAETDLLRAIGGFDMIYCGRHAGEDQDLGRRLAAHNRDGNRVFVHEPPFAWHPSEREEWGRSLYSNTCPNGHDLRPKEKPFERACLACPYFEAAPNLAPSPEVNLSYDPGGVEIFEEIPPVRTGDAAVAP